MIAKQARRKYLWHPLNWPSWILASVLYPFAFLPEPIQTQLGKWLGALCFRFMPRRKHIAAVNLKLCFPDFTETERAEILKNSFTELGLALIETNFTWWRPRAHPRFTRKIKINGLEAIRREHDLGYGILVIGAHFSTLELAGATLARHLPFTVTMRRLKNPVFDFIFKRARKRHYAGMLDRTEIKGMLKTLNRGGILWYAPDQDYGAENSVFVPFFKQNAASLRITPKLVARTKAKVFFGSHYRVGNQLEFNLLPMSETFPTNDLNADVTLVNRYLEDMIRIAPEQYLWIHRRFKTQENEQKSSLYKQVSEAM